MNNLTVQSSQTTSGVVEPEGKIALGLGLTNECNLTCAFCYRDPTRADRLSLDQVKAIMERLPIRSVNLGTGESGIHPDLRRSWLTCALNPSSSPSLPTDTA